MRIVYKRNGILLKNPDNETIKKIKTMLKVKPFVLPNYNTFSKSFKIYKSKDNNYIIPRYFASEINIKYNWKNVKDKSLNTCWKFNGKLRDKQVKIVNKVLKKINEKGGSILSLPPGSGKTVIGIYLAQKIKKKTLIVVHNQHLLNQWVDRVKMFSNATVGILRGKIIDIENKDIVIGMLQSLSKKNYDSSIAHQFGFCIYDECHHLGAEQFSKALYKFGCPRMLGLSATPNRADGLTKVFKYFIGSIDVKEDIKKNQEVDVDSIKLYSEDKLYNVLYNVKGLANVSGMITNLSLFNKRTELITFIVKKLIKQKRNILVLTHRRKHAFEFKDLIPNSGLVIGQMKKEEVEKSLKCQVIIGTYSSVSEGFDCNRLDTLVMTTPKKDIIQTVGRILRKNKYEIKPYILDFEDDIGVFTNQANCRRRYYKKQKAPTFLVNRYCFDIDKDNFENYLQTKYKSKHKKKSIAEELDVCLL